MTYPFGAVVGMDDMRLALLLNAVSPAIGGVLVRGEKGTAKSTAVRALAAVLPPVAVVPGCRFACDPAAPDPACPDGPHEPAAPAQTRSARLVELPVGASEDRVVGSLDLERALTEGVKAFEPGLLAAAHRGVLYVDEVNLLHDHLVDLLLDAAALGTAYVEREGVSVRHAARFLLVGTMNPEEGELRPQLLDRFGLTVEVAAPRDPAVRAEVVRRRFAHDADPAGFGTAWAPEEAALAARIADARTRLPHVVLSDDALRQVTAVCAAFDVDGLRADLVTARTAMAHAAWCGREEVTEDDVRVAARLALPHRRRRNPFDAPGLDDDTLDQALEDSRPEDGPDDDPAPPDGPGDGGTPPAPRGDDGIGSDTHGSDHETGEEDPMPGDGETPGAPAREKAAVAPSDPFRARRLEVPGIGTGVAGRRSKARAERGRVVGSVRPSGPVTRLHLVDTVLAAAPHQVARGRSGPGLRIAREDLRQATLEGREGNLVLFVVDASGSMGSRARMSAVKGAVLSLLLDAYQRRDKVGLVTFRGGDAELALPPTWSVEAAAARLRELPTGGRTPLAAGLLRAAEVLRVEHVRDPRRRPLLVVVTDGRATGARGSDALGAAHAAAQRLAAAGTAAVVVDCESGPVRLGLAGVLGTHLGAHTLRLEELAAESLAATVRSVREAA
ncbi:protoporphyrin IX magnesium-chelatase [Geodermatophilus amargosae]|uniref:Mg-protoporphyrin IX chelatase n=1 Tax=Geodermatophilus amargosae TaxID=1296565 RepID=A0A1I6XB95_9ACTN|nr:putative cobaltochelatase [Geodermatophilus amargosae]SFT35413.1 protoporphyrin IX magnesium-chelatase [Geodermatophilus amargosae]